MSCQVLAAGCTYNPTIVKQAQCLVNDDCDDLDSCSIDTCAFGLCVNSVTPDTDGDTYCDAGSWQTSIELEPLRDASLP